MSKTVIVERNVEATMRDGVILRADVYRPDGVDKLPVLLQRTPYGKGAASVAFALMAAERGYVVVIQDTRGHWASDGEGYPLIYEMRDGYDTVEWAARQPWADGQVGMFGGSYVGYTQWAAAAMQPPALKAIVPGVTFCDPYSAYAYTGGALQAGVQISWGLTSEALLGIARLPDDDPRKGPWLEQLLDMADGLGTGATFKRLPMAEMPLIGREGITTLLYDVLAHPTRDEYWQQVACPHDRVQVPAFHMGGWYDIFTSNTLEDFTGIRANGATEVARAHQKALIGPWHHGLFMNPVGQADFGVRSGAPVVLPEELQFRWFDYWLKGIDNGIVDEPPLRIFVMGDNVWRDEQEWPLARTRYTPYYLHSGGAANSLHGDGALSPDGPAEESVDTYVYDPRNPVPTRGGGLCCSITALAPGAYDQRPVEERPDVLVYTTPSLTDDMEVTGPLVVHLWAATSAPDTDFTAKLVDVYPCGYARNVQDSILRARYRQGDGQARLVTPGEVYEYTIDLKATSNVFKAGHCIRLEISSSNFPQFDRNLNTGEPVGQGTAMRPATQTILHDSAHPSHIVLPVIPR